MNIKILGLEIFLSNLSFLFLFLTTLYYWIKIIFFGTSQYKKVGLIGILSSMLLITIELIFRWVESGHFPLSNLYESLLFLAWGLLIFYSLIEVKLQIDFLGVFVSPVILSLVAFTTFSLPPELQESHPLVPALQSNWLFMHVSVMMLSYASLLLGCILSFSYLILNFFFVKKTESAHLKNELKEIKFRNTLETSVLQANPETETSQKLVSAPPFFSNTSNFVLKQETFNGKATSIGMNANIFALLDSLSYRTLSIGFCFLTLGILSGAVWANETWGNYWSWDPKETWAFITWLTFAIYLHTRLVQGWQGTKPAWIASFGFLIIWICYLGVNLLGKGLHSYGFLNF